MSESLEDMSLEQLEEKKKKLQEKLSNVKYEIKEKNGLGNFELGDLVKAPKPESKEMGIYEVQRIYKDTLYLLPKGSNKVANSSNCYHAWRKDCKKVDDSLD